MKAILVSLFLVLSFVTQAQSENIFIQCHGVDTDIYGELKPNIGPVWVFIYGQMEYQSSFASSADPSSEVFFFDSEDKSKRYVTLKHKSYGEVVTAEVSCKGELGWFDLFQ